MMRFVIITGMSGAGKSQVVKNMEDLGYYCVDNLPPALIPKFAEICMQGGEKMNKIALVIDIRGGELLKDLFPALTMLKDYGLSYEILFLEASDEVLIKRYKETRRIHPLAAEGRLTKGIREERAILRDIKSRSNHIIDTSNLTPKKLREEIMSIYVEGRAFEGLIISIISFGYKYGIPADCDLVFDVRFISNPFYVDSMRKLTGKHESVKEYVMNCAESAGFLSRVSDLLEFLIPGYIKEGKSQLVIGIGCTGGKHRSVVIAEALYRIVADMQHRVVIDHRDVDKDNRSIGK